MYRTFNCGVGMVVCVAEEDTPAAIAHLQAAGERAWRIGIVEPSADSRPTVVLAGVGS
jgi:phosphoribosylformylglycinamidine cyclo-ligase